MFNDPIPADTYDKKGIAITHGVPKYYTNGNIAGEQYKPGYEHGQIKFSKRIDKLPI